MLFRVKKQKHFFSFWGIVVAWPARLHAFPILYESGRYLCKFWTAWSTGGLTGVKIALKIENLLPNQQANPQKFVLNDTEFERVVHISVTRYKFVSVIGAIKKLGNKCLCVIRVSHAPAVDGKVAVAGGPADGAVDLKGKSQQAIYIQAEVFPKWQTETAMKILRKITSNNFSNIFLMGCVHVISQHAKEPLVSTISAILWW